MSSSRSLVTSDGITRAEAACILAVHVATVDRMIRRGGLSRGRKFATAQLSREQVEQLALSTRPVRHLVAGDYWVSRKGAAAVLGVSERRVTQLTDAGRVPYVEHRDGWRLYRREQIEVVGNARRTRFQTTQGKRVPVPRRASPGWRRNASATAPTTYTRPRCTSEAET
ncbi:MAG: hypothetical protein H0V23_09410 [Nocardioidaceae bacterium]|nr:hypothetical protein [Nocardioidaceae bacterium]